MTISKDNVIDILKRSDTISTYFDTIVNYELETESGKEYILEVSKNSEGRVYKIVLYYRDDGAVLFELTGGVDVNEFVKEVFEGNNPILDNEY